MTNHYRTPNQRWHFHTRLRDEEYARQSAQPEQLVTPAAGCYPVLPGLLAGEYPSYRYNDDPTRLLALLVAGITAFIDLTMLHETSFSSRPLQPYDALLADLAQQQQTSVTYQRHPIRDLSVPARAQMIATLDAIDQARAAGQVIYTHCLGGIGRTGTVIGCYLVRHGFSPEEALRHIARRLYHTHKAERLSPETDEQRAMVLRWQRGQ